MTNVSILPVNTEQTGRDQRTCTKTSLILKTENNKTIQFYLSLQNTLILVSFEALTAGCEIYVHPNTFITKYDLNLEKYFAINYFPTYDNNPNILHSTFFCYILQLRHCYVIRVLTDV